MWQGASAQKIDGTRGYGATVDLEASDPAGAFERLAVLHAETGRTLVHPFDDPVVIAGAGTVGLEILDDAPDVDASSSASGAAGSCRACAPRSGTAFASSQSSPS